VIDEYPLNLRGKSIKKSLDRVVWIRVLGTQVRDERTLHVTEMRMLE
jgi:hypothetical protein